MENKKTYLRILVNLVVVIFFVLCLIFVVPKLILFFIPFFIAWIIAWIAEPLVRFLEKRLKLVRKHSSAIIIILILAIITIIVYLGIVLIVKQGIALFNDFPNIIESIRIQLVDLSESFSKISKSLPEGVQGLIDKLILELDNIFSNMFEGINWGSIGVAKNFAKGFLDILFIIIITVLSSYLFIVNKNKIIEGTKKIIPISMMESWKIIVDNFKSAMGGYIKAMLKIMIVIIFILFAGLTILKVKYAFFLALGIAFLDFLPFFGTGAVLWPWALIDVLSGNYGRAIGLMIIYIVCQVVRQILQPKMVADNIDLNPLATLVFMFVGYRIYGVLGLIFGIPVGMALVSLYQVGVFDRLIRGFKIIIHDINEFRKF